MSTSWVERKTITECLRAYEEQELGLISDIAKHGCQGGVTGIIYYTETAAFHARHENEIWDMIAEHADQHGLKKGEFLQHLSKDPGSLAQLVNDLVWWAVEVRAQELQEGDDS
jgi:hypothetical protein